MKPFDVFSARRFNWSQYLQQHIAHSGVNVSGLHPIMGLRLAALFMDLTDDKLASETPGQGYYQIISGVRTREQQIALYNDICLRQGRCSYVASPYSGGLADSEGVRRYGSNHQAQRQSALWSRALGRNTPVEVGYAVDIRTSGSWAELHSRLARFGLEWPMKGSPYEPWHLEAHPRATGWVTGPWPHRPGVYRPLYRGLNGGDVRRLQHQLGIKKPDGDFGPATARRVRRMQRRIKRPVTGLWNVRDQVAFERYWKNK